MILYTNGDSFIAGTGLALDLIPDSPGDSKYLTSQQIDKRIGWIKSARVRYQQMWGLILAEERKRNFPYLLSQLLECELVDSSHQGSSFDRITRTTLTDLINILNRTQGEPIVAIIGETCPFRRELPVNLYGNVKWMDVHHQNYYVIPEIRVIYDYIIRNDKEYHRLVEFYKNVISIQSFCKANNIELHWTSVGFSDRFDFSALEGNPDLQTLKEHANYTPSVDMLKLAELAEYPVCADGGHFSSSVHRYVAEQYKKILEKYKK